jgi:hypothetical protein
MVGEQIIQEAIHQFQKHTGIPVKEVPLGERSKQGKFTLDSRVRVKAGKEVIEFAVEAKNELRKIHLPGLLELIERRKEEHWLIISQYIPKPLKEELRNLGINYLEASGNCFIRQGSLYVYINDQVVTPARLPEGGKLWKVSGLKFLFVVLQNPEMINAPYRILAKASGAALGYIGPFIEELKKEGYVKSYEDDILFIENKDQLRNKWVELFSSLLRPKLKRGMFRFMGTEGVTDNWKNVPATHFQWGGEAAGALMTHYLRPEKLTMYTSHPKMQIMKELRLVPDEGGNVELMEAFWKDDELKHAGKNLGTVPPLLAYAELATSLDSRNRETADKIKDLYLENDR